MMKLVFLLVAVAANFGAGDYTCGGQSGVPFNDEFYTQYGEITGFEIWHGDTNCLLDGISLKYGDVWGPPHTGGGTSKDRIEFAIGEVITAIDMDTRDYLGFELLCQLTVFTNAAVYGPFCNYECNNDRCGTGDTGPFRYISGRYGANLDSLTWHS